MKKTFVLAIFSFVLLFSSLTLAQSESIFPYLPNSEKHKFLQCAAILHDGKVLVDTYSTAGKCMITGQLKGTLSVSTISFDEDMGMTPITPINFRIAIRNDKSNTLWMYSNELVKEVDLEDVRVKLGNGDKIVFLTANDIYSLPHHEVEIRQGC